MRLYRALLHLYPAGFRTEYAADMVGIFEARRQRTRGIAVIGLWLGTIVDTIFNAARVHLDVLRQDLRYTLRGLRRTPGFAFAAVLMTGLGIGATTAAFSITDLVLIRPLSFSRASRLVVIWERTPDYGQQEPLRCAPCASTPYPS